jgi:hypothetical protein
MPRRNARTSWRHGILVRLLAAMLPVPAGCLIPVSPNGEFVELVALGGEALAGTGKPVNVDTSEIVGPTPLAPAAGERTYVDSVGWLGSHLAAHANYTIWTDGRSVLAQERLEDELRPCVLVVRYEGREAREASRRVRFISLAELDLARISVCKVTSGVDCACLDGTRRLALEVAWGQAWLQHDKVCFDSREAAAGATEALRHLAELCGARRGGQAL